MTDLTHDVEGAIGRDFDGDAGILEITVVQRVADRALKLIDRAAGGSDLADQRQAHITETVDLKVAGQVGFVINRDMNLVAGSKSVVAERRRVDHDGLVRRQLLGLARPQAVRGQGRAATAEKEPGNPEHS